MCKSFRAYSVDEDGNEHNFLAEYYRTTREIASNTFRKGYNGLTMQPACVTLNPVFRSCGVRENQAWPHGLPRLLRNRSGGVRQP